MTQEQKDDLFLIISQLKGNGQIDLRACAILRDAVEEIAAATPPPQGLAKEQKDNIGKLFDKYVSVGCVVTQGDKTEFLYALSGLLKSAAPQTDAVELLDYVKEHWIVGTSGMWRRQTDVRDQRTSNGLLQEYKTFKQNK